MSDTPATYIACCNQCECYKEVRLQNSGRFIRGYCIPSGQTLTMKPVAVSIPADCPRGLGYRAVDENDS